ncbi:DUF1758 domain-containing protein [Trichonephila clavipes]|nr:DUF1758 domain-containing protein [Trichonephila clavipes]
MTRRRAENREGSLGYPRFVRPVFTKGSKPFGIRKRSLGLDDLFKEFERLDSNLSLEESELQEFEDRYFYLNAKFNDKLDELNVQNQGLPKLSIPQFNGHFKDWINFKDLFVSTVHSQVSISNVEKFQYLKGLLTNEPASLIKHMPISNDSYEEAWQKLLDSALCEENQKDSPIREYKLCTVTYGTASAPYLATHCLFQTGLYLERDDPAVSSLIKESFCIDDLMAGAPSNWDSSLPEALATKWKTFQKEFEQVCSIHIPRWIHTASQQITLHGFCDASELAYASVIYAVQPQADGNTKVTLLVAKSRVASLKSVSIQDWSSTVHCYLHAFMQPARTS